MGACLAFGTCQLAFLLRDIKKTKWLTPRLRHSISKFAVSVAIVTASALAKAFADVDIDMLEAPDKLQPSFHVGASPRPWFINPFGNEGLNPNGVIRPLPTWAIFATIIPGAGMGLLNYLDQNLTSLLINRPSSGRKKPAGYHLDMMVLGAVIYPIVSILGLPFPCAATVRSVAHQNALTTFEDRAIPGVGTQRVATKLIETRWTAFAIHVLMLLATAFGPLLRHIPKGVLFGVFLFMGVSSMPGNQFFERFYLWGIFNASDYPQYSYVARLPIRRIHLYTAIQLLCFIILYILKDNKDTAVGFPFFIASLIVFRRYFGRFFTEVELAELDGHSGPALAQKQSEPADGEDRDVEIATQKDLAAEDEITKSESFLHPDAGEEIVG